MTDIIVITKLRDVQCLGLPPDGFDAVSVQNVGSTYIIVSWDLPTHSNGILINFSLYCNGALAGVLPLTHEKDGPPGGPPDPELNTNDIVISIFINKIINPDKSFGSSDPMCILLQLSSLLVEHTAPNIHDSNKHKRFHTLFDLLKYGLMSKYNVMCSSLDPMEELTASPPYPSWSRTWAWVICPPPPSLKLEILDPSLKLNVLSFQDQLNRMPLQ
ncbi:hypothetical protein EMCRGX_G025688 [Ephydatia muelleri]